MDSQSAKANEAGGPRGYDDDKKIKGPKRHALVDSGGTPIKISLPLADIKDHDGQVTLLKAARAPFLFMERLFADAA